MMIKKNNTTKPETGDNMSYAKSKNSSTSDARGISEIKIELMAPILRMVSGVIIGKVFERTYHAWKDRLE